MLNGGFKGKTDIEGGIGLVGTVSYDMKTVKDLDGVGSFYGAGVDLGEGIGISGDYTYGTATTDDGRQVSTHRIGTGLNTTLIPVEINTGVTKTKTITINVFDMVYDIYRFFK